MDGALGSEFSRHPEGLSFSGLRSEFSRSEFSRHPNAYLCLLVSSKSDRTDFRRLTLPVSLNVSLHGSHDLAIFVRLLLQSPMSKM